MYKHKASYRPFFTGNCHLQRTYRKQCFQRTKIQINAIIRYDRWRYFAQMKLLVAGLIVEGCAGGFPFACHSLESVLMLGLMDHCLNHQCYQWHNLHFFICIVLAICNCQSIMLTGQSF